MIERRYQKIEEVKNEGKIGGIDCIYLINLDARPEKRSKAEQQLAAFGLVAHRFSAIDGWALSQEAVLDCGLVFESGMETGKDKVFKSVLYPGSKTAIVLDKSCIGKSCYNIRLSLGAIGCALSHLSILQHASERGFETIWVLEDDFVLKKNPYLLEELLQKMPQEWDLLYTDHRGLFNPQRATTFWRPDLAPPANLSTPERIQEKLLRIPGRDCTHSMLLRRSGIKKILDHARRGLYLTYDLELAFVPDLQLFSSEENIVTGENSSSDTDLLSRKPYVSCRLQGDTGAQLFQIATTLSLGWDYDAVPVFPLIYHHVAQEVREQLFFRLDPLYPGERQVVSYEESSPFERVALLGNQVLIGAFRSWRHFHHHREEILACFAPSDEMQERLEELSPGTAAIYCTPRDLAYLQRAVRFLPEETRYLIVADEACREALLAFLPQARFLPDTMESFFLLTRAQMSLVGYTPLSWWIAYCNTRTDRFVLAPKDWADPHPPDAFLLPEWNMI